MPVRSSCDTSAIIRPPSITFDPRSASLPRSRSRVRSPFRSCGGSFLGASGVGKSTLINALVAGSDVILPAGGIGPLAALAMQVSCSEEPCFEADCQPP